MRLLNHLFDDFLSRKFKITATENGWLAHLNDFRTHFPETTTHLQNRLEQGKKLLLQADQLDEITLTQDWLTNLLAQEESSAQAKAKDPATTREGWGYPALTNIGRYLPQNVFQARDQVNWYDFGHYQAAKDAWIVDKEALLKALLEEAWQKHLWLCPSFDPQRLSAIVQRLPEHLPTDGTSNWLLRKAHVIEHGKVVHKVLGVDHKKLRSQQAITTTRSVDPLQAEDNEKQSPSSEERKRNIPQTSFDDIGGIQPLLTKVREVIELPLRRPDIFEHLGIKPHRGVLLYGPPGCGKTLIAKAIAHEVEAHFISIKGPEVLNKYYGQSEENLRKLFEEARDMQPSILFFDEIDAIAQRRSDSDNLRMDARLVNQLLSLMDGVEAFGQVCVIAATNRINLLDEALLRPGRFDYKLEVPLPDEDGCKAIFDIQTRNMPVSSALDKAGIYTKLKGLSGADITYLTREAAYHCLRRQVDFQQGFSINKLEEVSFKDLHIERQDFDKAFESVLTKIQAQQAD